MLASASEGTGHPGKEIRGMKWPLYELAAYYNFVPNKGDYKTIRVRERVVLRHGSGETVLKDEIVTRNCRVHRGKVVLV